MLQVYTALQSLEHKLLKQLLTTSPQRLARWPNHIKLYANTSNTVTTVSKPNATTASILSKLLAIIQSKYKLAMIKIIKAQAKLSKDSKTKLS